MGVGLYLRGTFRSPKRKDPVTGWLTDVANWVGEFTSDDDFWGTYYVRTRQGRTYENQPALFVDLHPCAEEVEVIVPEAGEVIVSAKTSTVGPGYHTALCHLLQAFGKDQKVRWAKPDADEGDGDETGYFVTGDRAAVEDAMLGQIRQMAVISLDTLAETGHTLSAWNMPIGHSYDGYPVAGVRTPLGPRSVEWIRAVQEDPRQGIDFFPWWDEGPAAGAFLGRALCDLWSRVRWRPVLMDDEYDDWDRVCGDLARAYGLDPKLDYPWREWAELIDILNGFEGATDVKPALENVIRKKASAVPANRPLIGYRRHPVRVDLVDGWSITIPGRMAEQWEESTWSAWDGKRTVWVTTWTLTKDGTPVPAADALDAMKLDPGKVIRHKKDGLVGKAIRRDTAENGQPLRNLQAFSAVDGKTALCNVFYPDKSDDDWATETWHSLTAR